MCSADDPATTGDSSVRIDGHVEFGGILPVDDLLGLATGIDDGRPSIALVDVLAHTRLSAQADVLLMSGEHPPSVALPVRAVLRQPNIRLIVASLPPASDVVLLDAPGWTDLDDPLVVGRVTALTFEEFGLQ